MTLLVPRQTLFWTPHMESLPYGLHRTYCLPAFQSHVERPGTPNALCADRGGTGVCRDACVDRHTTTDVADATQVSSVLRLSARLRDDSHRHPPVSVSTTPPAP